MDIDRLLIWNKLILFNHEFKWLYEIKINISDILIYSPKINIYYFSFL